MSQIRKYLAATALGAFAFSFGFGNAAVDISTLTTQPFAFAQQLSLEQRIAEQEKTIRQAKEPSDEAYLGLSSLYLMSEEFEKAREAAEKAIKINPMNIGARLNLGSYLLRTQQVDAAIRILEEALTLSDKELAISNGIHNNLAALYGSTGNFEKVIGHADAVLKRAPFDGYANYNMGNALYRQGRYDEAARHFVVSMEYYNLFNASLSMLNIIQKIKRVTPTKP